MKVLVALLAVVSVGFLHAQTFPDDWIGTYRGDMILGSLVRPNDTVSVEFDLQPIEADSSWSYKMTYNSKRFGVIVKDYKIVAKRVGEKKQFFLDENNGIVMELSLMNGTFYGMYEVMDQMYISTMRKTDEGVYFDLFGASMENPTVTSSGEGDEKVDATSFRTNFHQTVLLIPVE